MPEDGLWYKDALIYQLHVKAFFDADDDGIGDFAGLTSKLDYIQGLGVTAVWLLPFYPSPLKDDGYDISDYTGVHGSYGTMRDFRRFVNEAHRRGLRVITELVINHTSDAHPWFQRARRSPPASAFRNYYVWSDTDRRYEGTRIIFTDTEKSNWAWDPIANAYYWHRFFSHQPDLNFDNLRVLEEVLKVMRFWCDHGVDGLRLDAVPYLCEREGTTNENLPETHAIIRRIRSELERTHPGSMLLAEANQWPEDVRPYFGEGDECHMAFHFPLMPRLYMAIAQEDRHPITDIMRQTPEIPDNCQWALFLRNHDELTLEMVTDREWDYLWNFYATDRQMRINLGIRRRLAPLVDGDRSKIHLLQSLLLSLPGTPVLYYGDEIGMGDNIYLGDRNGVRTPMQWTPDRNGGFSRADPARLYLPPIMDPVYGYASLNVEAQNRRPTSLLNWMRRIIAVRKASRAFSRGTIRFLHPGNRKVLMYLREYEDELVLCAANLSRAPQPVEMRMPEYAGRVPIELLGRTAFPPIGELPYFLSLPGHGFYWFRLAREAEAPEWHEPSAPALPEFVTLVIPQGWRSLIEGPSRRTLEQTILPEFLVRQRWFTSLRGSHRVQSVELLFAVQVPGPSLGWLLGAWRARTDDGQEEWFLLPMAIAWERGGEDALAPHVAHALGRVRKSAQVGGLFDALYDEGFIRAVIQLIREQKDVPIGEGETLRFRATPMLAELPESTEPEPVQRIGQDQVNTSLRIGRNKTLKAFRFLYKGLRPELEVSRFLTDVARFPNAPRLFGWIDAIDPHGEPIVLGMLRESIVNQGDGWTYALEYLVRYLEQVIVPAEPPAQPPDPHAAFAELMYRLGERTAQLHRAFAMDTDDPAFRPEPTTRQDRRLWIHRVLLRADEARRVLEQATKTAADESIRSEVDRVLDRWKSLLQAIHAVSPPRLHALKTRYHGNLSLEKLLVASDDFYFVDFEGEPSSDEVERRAKSLPIRDVATMMRSFHDVAWAAVMRWSETHPDGTEDALLLALDWRKEVAARFLAGYVEAIRGCPSYPADEAAAQQMLTLFRIEKALQEIPLYAASDPRLLRVPLQAILRLVSSVQTAVSW